MEGEPVILGAYSSFSVLGHDIGMYDKSDQSRPIVSDELSPFRLSMQILDSWSMTIGLINAPAQLVPTSLLSSISHLFAIRPR
jgi:hypothetical protein